MTNKKIKDIQTFLLNDITNAINNSMSIEEKIETVRYLIKRYDIQLNKIEIDKALEELEERDKDIVEVIEDEWNWKTW